MSGGRVRLALFAAALSAPAWILVGCADLYYRNWAPSYRHETMHLGEVRHEADARAGGLAGAGRASVYGAEAAISNPAALARLDGSAVSVGGGYRYWAYSVQPDQLGTKAQSFLGSFAGSYAAAAWAVAPRRFAVGAAVWAPHDYTYEIGGEGKGGEVKSRGALRALGPAAAVGALGCYWGVAGDFLWGAQEITSSEPRFEEVDLRATGYDVRASVMKEFDVGPGWRLSAAAVGKKGAAVRFRDGRDYEVRYPPTVGGAVSLRAGSVNVHLDYLYTFYESMEADDPDVAREIAAVTRNAGWASAGAEYVTESGAVARTGVGYRPWYINDGASRRVEAFRYALGGGWPVMDRHGRLDAALAYGRRGALDRSGYAVDVMEFQATMNYYW